MPDTRAVVERFWAKVDRSGGLFECWPWTAARFHDAAGVPNYGMFAFRGRVWKASRVAWVLTHGEIPDGLTVCHTCDNPPCVNPAHLWLGTLTQNRRDSIAKGRHAHGTRVGGSKLTEGDVWDIATGKTWKHVA